MIPGHHTARGGINPPRFQYIVAGVIQNNVFNYLGEINSTIFSRTHPDGLRLGALDCAGIGVLRINGAGLTLQNDINTVADLGGKTVAIPF